MSVNDEECYFDERGILCRGPNVNNIPQQDWVGEILMDNLVKGLSEKRQKEWAEIKAARRRLNHG